MEESRRIAITDPVVGSGKARLNASWGVGNAMCLFSAPKGGLSSWRGGGDSSGIAGLLHDVRFETTLFSPVMRKLVNESSQAFFSLQKLEGEENFGLSQIASISRQYRCIIRDCQQQLDGESEDAHCRLQSELLYKLELIWQLVEVLFIEKNPSGVALHHLLQWISLHFPACEDGAKNVLSGGNEYDEKPETHPDFWESVILFVMQGKIEHARTLLRLHSDMGSDPLNCLDELLRRMPCYGATTTSVAQFEVCWRRWQSEVDSAIDRGEFSVDSNLRQVARILSGSDSAFVGEGSPQTVCETWYEWMIGKLLYTNPTVKFYDLSLYAEEAIGKFGGLNGMTTLDSVILAAFEMNVLEMMNELCSTLDNFWFPSHLMDLLHHAEEAAPRGGEAATASNHHPGEALREFLLLDYATCLMSHNSLWQVGVAYLDHCAVQGRHRLELLLERIPLSSQRKAEKIVSIASQRGMTSVITSTCRVMGARALKQGRLGTAMAWGLKSQDAQFTTFLADQLLGSYCQEGTFSSIDLLDNLGSCMVVSDRLTFLAKYREFHRLNKRYDFRSAATLLHSLLWSRLAPKYFWVTLLLDTVPFLADGFDAVDVVDVEGETRRYFSSEQTYELLHCLQELCSERSDLPKKQQMMLEEHEPLVRARLARNLAVSLMDEGDASSKGTV